MEKNPSQLFYEKKVSAQQAKINHGALSRYMKLEEERKEDFRERRSFVPKVQFRGKDKFTVRRSIINDYDGLAIERILNKSDLFPIAYLQIGLNVAKAVCRISLRSSGGRHLGYGTGFMVSPNLMLTNNHVLHDKETAKHSLAEFNFEDDEHFMPRPVDIFRLNPDRLFITDSNLDFTLVAVHDTANTNSSLDRFGHLPILPQAGKILEGEYVSIIQHPQGGPKAVTVRENQVRFLSEDFIHYVTDTEPGSSGSPVFNDQWTVVALHHAGVPDPEDGTKWIANEGIRMSSIVKYLENQRNNLDEQGKNLLDEALTGNPLPSIDLGGMKTSDLGSDWYRTARGYDETFLGSNYVVPLPKLKEALQKDIAQTPVGETHLKYTHFSILMSKSRRLAFYTATNIDGGDRKKIKRTADRWYFDPRISPDFQSGPALYSKNELDRGHLVRRLDPVWGEDAARANEETFHFTNCAPQHKNLNQKTWLKLEDYILKNAKVHELKIVVFTGPVFRSDDMVYRGEFKVPAEFWKVVVMVKIDGTLSATAYLQTQKNLLPNLEFAYGAYETYQVPVSQIEELTGIDFVKLRDYDPMAAIETTAAILIEGEDSIRL